MRRLVLKGAGVMFACLVAGCAPTGHGLQARFDQPRPLGWGVAKPLRDDACIKQAYLARILKRFNWVQAKTWGHGIRMVGIYDAHEVDFKPIGPETMVDKVYCRAKADIVYPETQKIKTHKVTYVVAEDAGIFGVVPDVDFCVAGLDWTRFRLHEPNCRVLNSY